MRVLCLVEQDGSGVADASLRALSFARDLASSGGDLTSSGGDLTSSGGDLASSGGGLAAVLFGDATALASETPAGQALAGYGVSDAYVVEPGQLAGYAPLAWARVLAGLIGQTGAGAVVAAGTDRGGEVMAHLGALAGAPMAANCVSAAPPGTGRPARVRPARGRPARARGGSCGSDGRACSWKTPSLRPRPHC